MTHDRTVQSNRVPYPIVLIKRQVEKEVITVNTPSPTSPSPVPSIISDPPSTPIIISNSLSTTHSHQEDKGTAFRRRLIEEYMAGHQERMAKKRKKRKNPFL